MAIKLCLNCQYPISGHYDVCDECFYDELDRWYWNDLDTDDWLDKDIS